MEDIYQIKSIINSLTKKDFAVDSTNWLDEITEIDYFSQIEPLLNTCKNRDELTALLIIIREKYINQFQFKGVTENFFDKNYSSIWITEDKNITIDFDFLSKSLRKLQLKMCRNCQSLYLPKGNKLEMLVIGFLPKLQKIENIQNQNNIVVLEITKCNKMTDFGFIRDLRNLKVLNLSNNKNLLDLSFLSSELPIVILNLSTTSILKNEKNINYLKRLSMLKVLNIKANSIELTKLRKEMQNCIINGEIYKATI